MMSQASVLVVGVAVVDFVFRVDAMPDRPQKYRARDAFISGGGNAANAAVSISRLGGRALLAARLGTDPVGEMILSDLLAEMVDCSLVRRIPGGRSSFSSVLIDAAGERQIVNFRDPELSADAHWLAADFPRDVSAVLADTRWGKGAQCAMEGARRFGFPGIIDAEAPVGEAADALQLASHVAFSMQGLADFTGRADAVAGLQEARRVLDAWLCVTDGENGVVFLDGNTPVRVPALKVTAVDTLGAGDVWHGAFALRLAEGAGERDAVGFANAAAALKCSRLGGRKGAPSRSETERMLQGRNPGRG